MNPASSIRRPHFAFVLAGLALLSVTAHAGDWRDRGERYERDARGTDYARVLDVEPLVERVRYSEPVQECYEVARPERRIDRNGSTVLGGVIGAVVGSQFGSGDGRRAATVAGALLGGAIGRDSATRIEDRRYRDDPYYGERVRYEERCAVREEARFEERVRGYRVTYRYLGRDYVTELPYDPGRRLRVAVDARPL